MTAGAVALTLGAVALALALWSSAQRWWIERRVAARLPIAATGIIPGAEGRRLDAPSATLGVVVLHGFGDTPQTVEMLASALRENGYDVVAPLLPGHGRTLREFAASTREEWLAEARAAHASMRARHSRVALVGLSLGGALAATVAADDPELAALVLLAPYLDAPRWLRHLSRAAPAIGVMLPYVGGDPVRSIHDPEARANALGYGATTPTLVRELIRAADGARLALPRVTAPTLYIQSREDNRITEAVAKRAFAALGAPQKRLELLSGCGHVLTVDYCRHQVTTMVLEWLASATPGAGQGTA